MYSGTLILCPCCRLSSVHSTVRPGGSQRKLNLPPKSIDTTQKHRASSHQSHSRPGLWTSRIQTQPFSFLQWILISLRTDSTLNGKPSLRKFRLSLPRTAILTWIQKKSQLQLYPMEIKKKKTKQKQTFHSKFKIQSLEEKNQTEYETLETFFLFIFFNLS